MINIIISDTHSPQCINKSFNYCKDLLKKHPYIDAIVINGDLLGIFSMASSTIHRGKTISKEELNSYLEEAAPFFYNKFKETGNITESMVLLYFKERGERAG